MKTAAVISEYNPFHNGHKYLNTAIKEHCADAVISIMSGSFTQRGDVAMLSKFSRTKTALKNGCDLVLELPTPYAVSNAEIFAKSGVRCAKALGCVDYLCFGSEIGDTHMIKTAALAVTDRNVQLLVREHMKKGDYYPRALFKAVTEVFGLEIGNILSSPNNVLGIEYCKALRGTEIKPRSFLRKGAEHDSFDTSDDIASASNIRSMVKKKPDSLDFSSFTPYSLMDENPVFFDMFDTVIMYLLRLSTPEKLRTLPDISEGLEHRILAAATISPGVQEVMEHVKTKRYTMAKLRRIMVYLLLGITKEMQSMEVPYLRVLGFNETGKKILTLAKVNSDIPIIVKPSDSMKTLDENARKILEKDILATDIRELGLKAKGKAGRDYTNGLVVI